MLVALAECVQITSASNNIFTFRLRVAYTIDPAIECDFFRSSRVAVLAFIAPFEGHEEAEYELSDYFYQENQRSNEIDLIIERENTYFWIRQCVLIFCIGDEKRYVQAPEVYVKSDFNDVLDVQLILFHIVDNTYHIDIKFFIYRYQSMLYYKLNGITFQDEYEIYKYYKVAELTIENEEIMDSSNNTIVRQQYTVNLTAETSYALEAAEIYSLLSKNLYTNISFVMRSVSDEKELIIRKTNIFIDNIYSYNFQLPECYLFKNKIGFVFANDALLTFNGKFTNSASLINVNNHSQFINLSRAYTMSQVCEYSNYKSYFLFVQPYYNNGLHRAQLTMLDSIYSAIVSNEASIANYKLNGSVILCVDEQCLQKGWNNLNFTLVTLQINQIVVYETHLLVLICSDNEYPKYEEMTLELLSSKTGNQYTDDDHDSYQYSGIYFSVNQSILPGCNEYKLADESYFINQSLIEYADKPEYRFSRVLTAVHQKAFYAIGQEMQPYVHYKIRVLYKKLHIVISNIEFQNVADCRAIQLTAIVTIAVQLCIIGAFFIWLHCCTVRKRRARCGWEQ